MNFIASKTATLIELLSLQYPESSKNTVRSWIELGRITVDGLSVKRANWKVKQGMLVSLKKKIRKIHLGIEVLYEDADLIVINKPAGVLTVATDFEEELTAHYVLKRHALNKRVFPVHRLDRETSGVLVFAHSEKARAHLKKLFSTHDIEREYIAIVEGELPTSSGKWESFLKEEQDYRVRSVRSPQEGRLSITHYEVLSCSKNRTLLKLTLETGRKNQIRVHCSENKFPIIGDKKYGATTDPASRLGLHAYKLAFLHPTSNKKIEFRVPLPESFSPLFSFKNLESLLCAKSEVP